MVRHGWPRCGSRVREKGGIVGKGSTQLQNGVSDDDVGIIDGGKNAREILIPFMGA